MRLDDAAFSESMVCRMFVVKFEMVCVSSKNGGSLVPGGMKSSNPLDHHSVPASKTSAPDAA